MAEVLSEYGIDPKTSKISEKKFRRAMKEIEVDLDEDDWKVLQKEMDLQESGNFMVEEMMGHLRLRHRKLEKIKESLKEISEFLDI